MSAVFEQEGSAEIAGCAGLSPRDLAEWMLESPPKSGPTRMQTQLHKHIWSPTARGV